MRLTACAVLALSLGAARPAHAYPQFQFSLDRGSCGTCHYSSAGGGLLDDYGRDAAQTAVSRGGDGRFLHGLWAPPSWLALGGDARLAVGDHQVAGSNERFAFPMQLDLYARAALSGFSVNFTAGLSGAARDPVAPVFERLASREHYAMYERSEFAVRIGRFYPVFGLRLADHTAYVRRFLGFGLLEQPYALELSRLDDRSELRVAGFVPQPIEFLGAGYRARGAAAAYERRISDAPDGAAAVGLQARFALGDDERRYTLGAIARWWMPGAGLLWLAELDVQRQALRAAGVSRAQLAGYLASSTWLTRGVLVTAAFHLWDPDIALRGSSRTAIELDLQYFPRAHAELHLLVRGSAEGNDLDAPGALTLLQLHYYL
jgi:hypothetical protein